MNRIIPFREERNAKYDADEIAKQSGKRVKRAAEARRKFSTSARAPEGNNNIKARDIRARLMDPLIIYTSQIEFAQDPGNKFSFRGTLNRFGSFCRLRFTYLPSPRKFA